MSKIYIKPLTTHNVNKALCTKHEPAKKLTELTEAFHKYREQNLQSYRRRCDYFLAGVQRYHDDNYDVLVQHKSSVRRRRPNLECICSADFHCGEKASLEEAEKEQDGSIGHTYRRRFLRHHREHIDIPDTVCGIEPWFKRYLILSRFIEAVRKVIIKNRMMKRLARLQVISCNKELVDKDREDPLRKEYLTYGELTYQLECLYLEK